MNTASESSINRPERSGEILRPLPVNDYQKNPRRPAEAQDALRRRQARKKYNPPPEQQEQEKENEPLPNTDGLEHTTDYLA